MSSANWERPGLGYARPSTQDDDDEEGARGWQS
jgi:hypothetical protein